MADSPPDAGTPKRRKTPRAVLACTFCRQRKARCSGTWPACAACRSRQRACVYPGQLPLSIQSRPADPRPVSPVDILPSTALRRQALAFFRDNYASSLLCFIPPQQLVEDDAGHTLAPSLLACILTLVSRFLPGLADAAGSVRGVDAVGASPPRSLRETSDMYAAFALRTLDAVRDDAPTLVDVQCALILCLYELGEGAEHRGWLRLGRAVRSAQLLHLHRQDDRRAQAAFDWGSAPPSASHTLAEARRRTFWCCFCLERLLANGRDRIASLQAADVSTQLPQPDEDFIYARPRPVCRLRCSHVMGTDTDADTITTTADAGAHAAHHGDSILAHTVRVTDLLSEVMTWHGRGGRHLDARAPWLPAMPFSRLRAALRAWKAALPPHLDYVPHNAAAVIAAGQGRLWALMFMVYFQARAYLHREYIPFTPKQDYDPAKGPCDGPPFTPTDVPMPPAFWYQSMTAMVESANAISDLYVLMRSRNLSAAAYLIPGLGLLTAASIHVQYTVFGWDSMRAVATPEASRRYLQQDMEGFNDIGQHWSLAIHWIRQASLYYKLNSLTRRSWSDPACTLASMDTRQIKDGIMNYIRQISPQDRATRDASLRATFNFAGWLAVLERSVGEGAVHTPDTDTQDVLNPANPFTYWPANEAAVSPPFPWFSDMDGLAATPLQAHWIEGRADTMIL